MNAVPWEVAGPVAGAMAFAIGALWREIRVVKTSEKADCREQIARLDARIELIEKLHADRVTKLEAERDEYRRLWQLEVERGPELAAMIRRPEDPPPKEMPPPTWEESTEVRRQRATIERRALDRELRHYLDSTPPKPRERQPSRPR